MQALALPEFASTAITLPPFSIISISYNTGAAFTTFDVNTPANTQGASLKINPQSSRSKFLPLILPLAAEALKPVGVVTPP